MFCPSCGSENPDGAKFCSVCGTAIGAQDQNQKIRTHTHEASFRVPSISTDWLLSLSLMEKAALGSAAVVIIAFFLPLITFEVFGSSLGVSAAQFTFGYESSSMEITGSIENSVMLLAGVLAGAGTILLQSKKRSICQVVCGCFELLLVIGISNEDFLEDAFGSVLFNLGPAYYLMLIASLVLIGVGVWGLFNARKMSYGV